MSSVEHGTFTLERVYPAPPARVYAAWAEPEAKAQWFGGEDFSLDFRVGGTETNAGGAYRYQATYRDIVDGERIAYTTDMFHDGRLISISLATIEFAPDGDGTRLTLTEHGAFLDGLETAAQREHGTGVLLDKLGEALAGARV
jgi:uncharacterized protein YndB with AHSA1/START domain